MSKGTVLSGMRPTGKLHIGHLSVLENWAKMQDDYNCYFMVADLHSLTTKYDDTANMHEDTRQMVLDWLGAGIDPVKSAVFVQSSVKEHAELHLYLSMNIPLSWLERCPTYKDQVAQFGKQGKDITTYGFLGYPVLMASDILLYLSDTVPVGEDQLPHLEMSREIARRFNFLYQTDLFPEPKALLGRFPLVPGVDGRKMSKSYANDIAISATSEEVKKRTNAMVTDPGRVRLEDLGNPENCIVNKYQEIYNGELLDLAQKACRTATRGCVKCKKDIYLVIEEMLEPIRRRKAHYENGTYDDLREYLQKLNNLEAAVNNLQEAGTLDDTPVTEKFDIFWKNSGRKDKELLKQHGQSVIADYKAGAITLNDVQSLLDARFDFINLILIKGNERARKTAAETINKARAAMNLRF
ncbi:MAG TPA: tryptophan--tRNA ligase [Desulfobacteria bacterium]|nr:tryptophan--tRNA ligase [Desulfobacteria bacterium]